MKNSLSLLSIAALTACFSYQIAQADIYIQLDSSFTKICSIKNGDWIGPYMLIDSQTGRRVWEFSSTAAIPNQEYVTKDSDHALRQDGGGFLMTLGDAAQKGPLQMAMLIGHITCTGGREDFATQEDSGRFIPYSKGDNITVCFSIQSQYPYALTYRKGTCS
jgi:hypothetical protein